MMDATMILNEDGTAVDASPEALAILGVTMDQLRDLPGGAFSASAPDPEGDAAFRDAWVDQGSPDIGGEATIQRLDGDKVRVKFAITPLEGGRYRAVLMRAPGSTEAATSLYTAGEVLAQWRAAERRLETLTPGSPELEDVQSDIEVFRARYQELFRSNT